jgi:hypothetical protein
MNGFSTGLLGRMKPLDPVLRCLYLLWMLVGMLPRCARFFSSPYTTIVRAWMDRLPDIHIISVKQVYRRQDGERRPSASLSLTESMLQHRFAPTAIGAARCGPQSIFFRCLVRHNQLLLAYSL